MVALKWSMKNLYGVEPGEVYWAASDVGWVVGHSYIVYAPLFHGCTIDPLRGQAGRHARRRRVLARDRRARVRRDVHRADRVPRHQEGRPARASCFAQYDLSKFRTLFLAGERADPDTIDWAENLLKKPVIDHWWQTETGWAIAGNPVGLGQLPVKHGSPTVRDAGLRRARGRRAVQGGAAPSTDGLDRRQAAAAAVVPADAVAGRTSASSESYLAEFPGYYKTADAGFKDEDGYLYVMGRTDDIINVAGHRLSTGGMEEVLAAPQGRRRMRGDRHRGRAQGRGAVRLHRAQGRRQPADRPRSSRRCVALVREKIGPVAAFKLAITVARLPKTRSGKILRGTMKKIADGEPWTMPATIDDPAVLDEIGGALKGKGVGA